MVLRLNKRGKYGGWTQSTFTHWNDIDVVAFCLNLECFTDLNVGLLSSMSFSGFAPSPMGEVEIL